MQTSSHSQTHTHSHRASTSRAFVCVLPQRRQPQLGVRNSPCSSTVVHIVSLSAPQSVVGKVGGSGASLCRCCRRGSQPAGQLLPSRSRVSAPSRFRCVTTRSHTTELGSCSRIHEKHAHTDSSQCIDTAAHERQRRLASSNVHMYVCVNVCAVRSAPQCCCCCCCCALTTQQQRNDSSRPHSVLQHSPVLCWKSIAQADTDK